MVLGDLYTYVGVEAEWDDSQEKNVDLTKNEEWDLEVLGDIFTDEVVEHIVQNVKPPKQEKIVINNTGY